MEIALISWGLVISGSVAIVLALAILQHRETGGNVAFALIMIASAIWSWGYFFQINALSPDLAMVAVRIKYLGIVSVPACWLWFALTYTDRVAHLTRRQAGLLAFFPFLTVMVNMTNDWHSLFYRRITVTPPDVLPRLTFEYGPWYWLHVSYSYILVLAGTWLLIRFWRVALQLQRAQIALLTGSLLCTTVISLAFYAIEQFKGLLDITPILIAVNGMFFYLALFRPGRLDARPIAYAHLFEQSNDGVLVFDTKGTIIDCNPAARRLLDLANPIGQPVQTALQQWPALAHYCLSAHTNEPIRVEHSAQVLDARCTALCDRRGERNGYMLSVRDMTDQWRAQQALAASEAALREERRLFIGGPTVVFRWEARNDYPVSYVSPNVQEQFGYAPEAFTEGRLSYLSLIHPDDRPRVEHEIIDHVGQKATWYRQEYRLQRADGEYRWIHNHTTVVYDNHNTPLYFLGYVLDVTEQKRAEAERLDIERRLQQTQKLESLGLLARGVAHDFNNLLMAIMGNLDLASLTLARSSSAYHHVRNAILATRHAAGLTQQLLAYAGQGSNQRIETDLTGIIEGMADMLRVLVGRQTRLELQLDPHIPPFQADPSQIQQIVLNLILNAAEALPPDGGIIRLRTGVRFCDEAFLAMNRVDSQLPPNDYLILEVSDTGCGMDEETQRRMFDPFFTTKTMGRGLGMSAVLGIVRDHHGGIIVDSAPGCGTTISVLFPPSSIKGACAAPADQEPTAKPDQVTVLVVDDEADVRDVTARLLIHLGFRVIAVADGKGAIQALKEHMSDIACILLDAHLGDFDGPAVLSALRALAPHVAVVVASGYSQHDILERFANATIDGFLQKPYQMSELYGAVQRALKRTVMVTASEPLSSADAIPGAQ
ncbi:MAG: PAS domain S-box protein [Roseiflexus sp.]|nr:PAS domain S-box protein [Roseiflexus sp.]MCS7290792.1 PAS domain S-box protein [Roseiflexus sp.]MDW8144817.1 histidine kinase N-terminal 7TM domain-containing protein [Roseiflexaceae bacterium]MDW8232274.1 histidine kinase N-terminal 7TM domain-containing protein [Roseiflexaceae bacterium]